MDKSEKFVSDYVSKWIVPLNFRMIHCQKRTRNKYVAFSRAWQRISSLALADSYRLADVSYFIDHDNQRDTHKTNTDTCQKSAYAICTRKYVSFNNVVFNDSYFPLFSPSPNPHCLSQLWLWANPSRVSRKQPAGVKLTFFIRWPVSQG